MRCRRDSASAVRQRPVSAKFSPASFDRFLFHFESEKLAGFKHQIRSVCTALKARRATYSCRWREPPVYGNNRSLSPEGGTLCMIRCVALRALHRTVTKPVAYATGKGCAALRAMSLSAEYKLHKRNLFEMLFAAQPGLRLGLALLFQLRRQEPPLHCVPRRSQG
jgi:hypothetical protein